MSMTSHEETDVTERRNSGDEEASWRRRVMKPVTEDRRQGWRHREQG